MKTMKSITQILMIILMVALAVACQQDGPEAGQPNFDADDIRLTIIIPDLNPGNAHSPEAGQPSSRLSDPDADGRQQWQDGDVIYLHVWFNNDLNTEQLFTAVRTAGAWSFSKSIYIPVRATRISIDATYIGIHSPGEFYFDDEFLYSSTGVGFDSNRPAIEAVTLAGFEHQASHIRFTGLAQGDRVWFNNTSKWRKRGINAYYGLTNTVFAATDYITADANGTASLYISLFDQEDTDRRFAITNGSVLSRPDTNGATWYIFDPGQPNADGYYFNRRYTVGNPNGTGTGDGFDDETQWIR